MNYYFVYVLKCGDGRFYVGMSQDVPRRLKEHQSGGSQFTKQFSDIRLVYSEKFQGRKAAEKRERQLKGWSRAKKRALVLGKKEELVDLARSAELVEV